MKKIDILAHNLVPKHIILNEKGREELLKKYGIALTQLPRILVSDPVAVAINAKIGDILKIIRESPTAGQSEYYRVVVRG